MKGQWCYIGLCFILFAFIPWPFSFLFLIIVVLFHRHRFHQHTFLFLLLCFCMLLRYTIQPACVYPKGMIYQVKEIHQNYLVASNQETKVLLYGVKGVHIDDVIEIAGDIQKIDSIRNAHQFNFQDWSNRRGYFYSVHVKKYHILSHGHSIRHQLFCYIETLPKKQCELYKSIVFGIHAENINTLLVSCGLHISYIGYLVKKFSQKWISRDWANVIRLGFIILVSYCTVLTPSMIRLICFGLVDCFCLSYNKQDRLGLAICFLILLVPFLVFDITFYIPVCLRFVNIFHTAKYKQSIMNRITLAVLQFQFFHSCDIWMLFLFPVLRQVYGYLYLLTWLGLCTQADGICNLILKVMEVLSWIQTIQLPLYSRVYPIWMCMFIPAFIRFLSQNKKSTTISFLFICCLFFVFPYLSFFTTVTMLDVGQGDCTIISTPHKQKTYMIDIMGHKKKDIPNEIVIPYLRSEGIHCIDQLIITHHDFDHNGGLDQLCSSFLVKQVIDEKKSALNAEKDYLKFMLLNYQGEDENDNSIVTYLKFYQLSYLFMGDLGVKGEEEICLQYPNLSVDILKVGHHGSNTSSSKAFIHQLQPTLGLISCGRHNFYNHPNTSVLKTLKQEHCKPIITKESGSLTIKECKYFAYFITGDHKVGFLFKKFWE